MNAIIQRKAVDGHLTVLTLLKEFFRYIKNYERNNELYKYFNLNEYLISMNYFKKKTFVAYQYLMSSSNNVNIFCFLFIIFI